MFKDQVLKKEPEGSLPVLSLSAGIKAMVAFRKGQDFKQETWRDKLFSSFLQMLQEKGDGQLRKSMQFSIPGLLYVE